MPQVITASQLEELLRAGKAAPSGAILTPGARDLLNGPAPFAAKKPAAPTRPETPILFDRSYDWTPGADPQTPEELQRFFTSPEIEALKVHMCDIGRRLWEKDYTDGNGGNLTWRVGDNMVLCTPTLVSKGFMKPEHLCLVDLEGNQLAGKYKRTSEVNTHLGIMKRQPKAKACCHAHPPHATAFAVAKVRPPTCLIPEAEVFLGQIEIAPYETPGTPENARTVGETAVENQAVLMANHGVITWGKDLEDAYWKMENTDAYCRTIWVASQLGQELTPISPKQAKELIALRKSLGMDDPRENWEECQLCDNAGFRPGFVGGQPAPAGPCAWEAAASSASDVNSEAEALVQAITDQIMAQMAV